jgi:type I restriction enzyme S subunit
MTFVDESRLEEFKSVVIENGDLLMSLTGNIGRVVEVMGIDKPMFQNYRVGKFTPIDKQITKAFLKFVLSSDLLFKQFNGLANQSAQANFGKQDMDKLKLRFPISLEEQTAIAYVLQTVDKEIRLLKAKAEKLKEQKKGLMQQLLTGKVRLKIKE